MQPVGVDRLADMTCPAPVIELLPICLPWLSCCHIIVNLIAAVHHILIRCDKGIQERGDNRIFFAIGSSCFPDLKPFFFVLDRLPVRESFLEALIFSFCLQDLIHTHSTKYILYKHYTIIFSTKHIDILLVLSATNPFK